MYIYGYAEVEWNLHRTFKTQKTPLDVDVSIDGRWVFVLTAQGEILIYSSQGELKDTINVGDTIDEIKAGPREDILFLSSRKDSTVQLITLDFIQQITIKDSPYKGPADAPVAVAVFNDFQWQYCARLVPLLEQVLGRYPKEVKLVFKHYPLNSHKFARQAALAALSAGQQGKFWEFHDKLFENYDRLNPQKIQTIAQDLGLDTAMFAENMKDSRYSLAIDRDLWEGKKVGVTGTPAVFVNGKLLRNLNFREFQFKIDKELQKIIEKDKP